MASVNDVAITASDIDAEYRLEYFLQNARIPPSPPDARTFEDVRDRLISQQVLAQEAANEEASLPDASSQASQRLADLRKKLPTDAAFARALASLGLSEQQLLDALAVHERTLALINQQLRPLASVEQADIEAYYRKTFLPQFERQQQGDPPPLASVASQIREILIQKKINELLPDWIKGLKTSYRVRIVGGDDD